MKKNLDLWGETHPMIKKLIMELKIAILVIVTGVSSVFANPGYSQVAKVSLNIENKSLEQVMDEIETQSEFYFIFNQKQIDVNREINIQADNKLITDILPELFNGTNVNYVVLDRKVLLTTDPIDNSVLSVASGPELQQKVITGKITDSKGNTLPGVNVSLKGTLVGAIADINGAYSITIPNETGTLVFSFVGYTSQELAVNGKNVIDVVLAEETTVLNEVVVTALGIKKEAKRIGYATATVDNEILTTNRTINVGNSLQGKVAGLNISAPAGGPGGSSKIRIRGQSSFGADNSPLIVVNGVPINNSAISAGGSAGNGTNNPTGGSSDQGDGLQSINQDDIESMTVLKGAAAAALYGFRAKDGAIIITTKSGSGKQGIGIEFSSNFQADVALDYTDFQYIYGQGENNARPTTTAQAQSSGVWSFGEKLDGVSTPQFDGTSKPYVAYKNRIKDFYRTGTNFTNSIALTGQNDKGNFRLSFSNTDANAIVPNSEFHKKILNLGLNYKLTDKLSLQSNINYSNEYNQNPPQIGLQDMNANTTIYTMANSIKVAWLKETYQTAAGDEQPLARWTNRNNPYWVTLKRFENVRRDRLFGNVSLRYQFTNWLYVQGRVGQDYYTRPYDYNRPTGTRSISAAASGFNGYYYQNESTFRETNLDLLIGANKTFGDFGVDVTVGGNQMNQKNTSIGASVTNFYVRDLYTIGNGQTKNPFYTYTEKAVNSIYGSAELSYKSFLYLNLTARNDWFSTLNPNSNNYLYPSASVSYIFTQSFDNVPGWLNYGKIRASYAEVGGDTDPYSNNLYYSVNSNQFNGFALGSVSSATSPNPNLKPLKVKEAEFGLELRTLDSRVNLDLSVYKKNTVDEILSVDISNASGYSSTKVNVGQLENKGVEMLLTFVPVKTRDLTWETTFNGSINVSKVIQLANGQTRFDVGSGEFFGNVSHEVGKPLASLRGFDYKRNASGQILTQGGLFQQGKIETYGSAIPKYVGGWLNTINYKGFRLFAQVDFKAGHKIMSNSNLNFIREGLHKETLAGRETGVKMDAIDESTGLKNEISLGCEQFYTGYRSTANASHFIYKGDFVRLRSLSLGYDLSKYVSKASIRELTVSAVCNNVWLIKKYIDNLDPEAQVSTSDFLQGIETHTLPTTRSFGFNINVKF